MSVILRERLFRTLILTCSFFGLLVMLPENSPTHAAELLSSVEKTVAKSLLEFDLIPPERRQILEELAGNIRKLEETGKPIKLLFICTHNSRRSHLGQVWGAVAAEYYGVPGVSTFSGGTEATACNPRTIGALKRAGLSISVPEVSANPVYEVHFAKDRPPVVCFSKIYNVRTNPQSEFIAIMTCSDADEKCPIVIGAKTRFSIPYDDPKQADGTPEEAARYDERSRQILREMLYAFSRVKPSP